MKATEPQSQSQSELQSALTLTLGVNNAHDLLLVTDTQQMNVVGYDLNTNEFIGEFISSDVGLIQPQHIVVVLPDYPDDGNSAGEDGEERQPPQQQHQSQFGVYVSHGDTLESSAVAKFELDGTLVDLNFISNRNYGGGDDTTTFPIQLLEPHGFTFNQDYTILYVASSRSNGIIQFDAITGDYLGALVTNINGPSHVAIHPKNPDEMFITTKGNFGSFQSDNDNDNGSGNDDNNDNGSGNTRSRSLNGDSGVSHVYKYDIKEEKLEIFIQEPAMLRDSLGYVSLSDLSIQCPSVADNDNNDDCILCVTDFGGGLRAYNIQTRQLLYATQTSTALNQYSPGATGSLAVNSKVGIGYIPLTITNINQGSAILQYNMTTGMPPSALFLASYGIQDTSVSRTATTTEPSVSLFQSSNVLVQHARWLRRPNGVAFIPKIPTKETQPDERETILPPNLDTHNGIDSSSGSSSLASTHIRLYGFGTAISLIVTFLVLGPSFLL